ncbi:hypothetical protein [Actinoplanes sp. NPDC049599]|uniref:hypothetical protein n=1 Tax=Actinoplanes sp. NPDC049599 TaxID=3363903 RepID=UPI0037A182A9
MIGSVPFLRAVTASTIGVPGLGCAIGVAQSSGAVAQTWCTSWSSTRSRATGRTRGDRCLR